SWANWGFSSWKARIPSRIIPGGPFRPLADPGIGAAGHLAVGPQPPQQAVRSVQVCFRPGLSPLPGLILALLDQAGTLLLGGRRLLGLLTGCRHHPQQRQAQQARRTQSEELEQHGMVSLIEV